MESTTSTKKIIRISVEFQWFGQIDTANEKFQCRIRIESKWYENELMTEYNSKINWNPLLYIENCCYEKLNEDVSYEIIIHDNKTLITEIRISEGVFWGLIIIFYFLFLFSNLIIYFIFKKEWNFQVL